MLRKLSTGWNGGFLFAVIEKGNLEAEFIKLPYSNPLAVVTTNGIKSETFAIRR